MGDGKFVGGSDMFGYKLIDRVYTNVPGQADIVRRIFAECMAGIGGYSISKRLNQEGYKSFAVRKRTQNKVMSIISNFTYTGTKMFQKTFIENYLSKK